MGFPGPHGQAESSPSGRRGEEGLTHGAEVGSQHWDSLAHRPDGLEGVFGEPAVAGASLRLCRPSNGLFQNRILMS